MKRKPVLTKREKKTLEPPRAPRAAPEPSAPSDEGQRHVHCVSCGRHIDPSEFAGEPPKAVILACQHETRFAACLGCVDAAQSLLDEHDRLNLPVKSAPAWH